MGCGSSVPAESAPAAAKPTGGKAAAAPGPAPTKVNSGSKKAAVPQGTYDTRRAPSREKTIKRRFCVFFYSSRFRLLGRSEAVVSSHPDSELDVCSVCGASGEVTGKKKKKKKNMLDLAQELHTYK